MLRAFLGIPLSSRHLNKKSWLKEGNAALKSKKTMAPSCEWKAACKACSLISIMFWSIDLPGKKPL